MTVTSKSESGRRANRGLRGNPAGPSTIMLRDLTAICKSSKSKRRRAVAGRIVITRQPKVDIYLKINEDVLRGLPAPGRP